MKKLSLLSFVFIATSLFADVQVVSETDRELNLKLTLARPTLTDVETQGARYTKIEIPDSRTDVDLGFPQIPHHTIFVSVPNGKTIALAVTDLAYETIVLKHRVLPQLDLPIHSHDKRRSVSVNPMAYGRTYGENTIQLQELGKVGRETLAVIRWSPIRYEPLKNLVSYTKSLSLKLTFVGEGSAVHGSTASDIASWIVVNPKPPVRSQKKRDLVIAHESYRQALVPFLDWKKSLGHEIHDVYVSGKTAIEIQNLIKQAYASQNPPTSTLLIGSIDQVPAHRGQSDNTWTDFPHQVLDADQIPDLSLGRIPVQTTAELERFLKKVVARETAPRNVNDVLLTAGRDTSLGCPQNVAIVGQKFGGNGNPVTTIKKFKTEVPSEQVWDAYNANPNLIVYDGHGNRVGMSEIPLNISDLSKLNNTSYPIVLDIACLNANWLASGSSSRNFAETFLLDGSRGFAGILASGGSGMGHVFFQHIGDIMSIARKEINTNPLGNEIGRVIWAAKVKGNSQDRSYWNYYGDPTSSIWESTM